MKIENLSFVGIKQVLSRKDLKQIMAGCTGAGGNGGGGGGCVPPGSQCEGNPLLSLPCCDGSECSVNPGDGPGAEPTCG